MNINIILNVARCAIEGSVNLLDTLMEFIAELRNSGHPACADVLEQDLRTHLKVVRSSDVPLEATSKRLVLKRGARKALIEALKQGPKQMIVFTSDHCSAFGWVQLKDKNTIEVLQNNDNNALYSINSVAEVISLRSWYSFANKRVLSISELKGYLHKEGYRLLLDSFAKLPYNL